MIEIEIHNDNDNVNEVKSLSIVAVYEIRENVNPQSHFTLEGLDIDGTAVRSSCCIGVWNRCRCDGHGRVSLIFP